MPIVYQNPTYPFQTSFGGVQAASTQLNFREMIGEVTSWNPNVDPQIAGRWLNNIYRKIIDKRSWYGLKLKGQISVQAPLNGGLVSVTQGSPFVQGQGTTFDTNLIGLQFRTGFTFAYQTIVNVVPSTQTLQLDTPYGGPTAVVGYNIVEAYINFGANIKRLLWAVNQQQGWAMTINVPVQVINGKDTWRTNLGWSKYLATRSATPAGELILEAWPTPNSLQVFPFEAYQQPPNLILDNDSPVPWIASDLIVTRALANAMLFGGRKSDYYDPVTAAEHKKDFNERVEEMAGADNNMDQQDVTWDYYDDGGEDSGQGSYWQQSHA